MTDGFSFGRILPVNVWVVFFLFSWNLEAKVFRFLAFKKSTNYEKELWPVPRHFHDNYVTDFSYSACL